MSDEKQEGPVEVPGTVENVETTQAAAETPEVEKKQVDLQYGFVVGVNQDGGVMLDMIGEKKGLIEMLGLCKYAEYHLGYTLDAASGQGSPIISQQIHQLAEMMKVLLNVIAKRPPQDEGSRIVTP